ncbi:hypothetical protein EJB05_05049 [Eragrostis curvula]|uniref:Late embryogenesis abundant protein LEA-2 subgroup domain-containing protein n=1 Tax=Eragrostis curvula TaxID=38414 RepID=A0A5J9WDS9_9POAL|nr:hypothetical protein EJB05_05049 [Eragrostis curvula]
MAKTTQPSAGERDPLLPSASPPPYLDSHPADSYAILLVPVRLRRRLRRGCGSRSLGPILSVLAILALAGFLVWPSDPAISVARLSLEHVSVVARPAVAINISAALKVRVRNPDLFALDYTRLAVDIGYRGSQLGRVTSGGGASGPARCRTSTPTSTSTAYAWWRTRSTCSRISHGDPCPSTPSPRSRATCDSSSSGSPSREEYLAWCM